MEETHGKIETVNQEMTPIPENIRYKNAPSEASEQARYNQGYKDGLIRATEIVIMSVLYKDLADKHLADKIIKQIEEAMNG